MAFKKLKLWFDKDLALLLANKFDEQGIAFPKAKFAKSIDKGVQPLELKDRVAFFADELHLQLGGNYEENIKKLLSILGPENKEQTGMFNNFYWVMPIAKYVEKYGLDNLQVSIKAMEEVTKRNTSEYAIRPFIDKYENQLLKQMLTWSTHKNFHVRRLACEGGRPRLPWAKKFQQYIDDPSPLLPILENLKDDKSVYVQNSVANCLNDILKDNEAIGKALIKRWTNDATPARKWIIKHSIRNFRKKEDPWALDLTAKFS